MNDLELPGVLRDARQGIANAVGHDVLTPSQERALRELVDSYEEWRVRVLTGEEEQAGEAHRADEAEGEVEALEEEIERLEEDLADATRRLKKFEGAGLSFKAFSEANHRRCEARDGYNEPVHERANMTCGDWLAFVASEVGELADAILGASGKKARRKNLTWDDVCDEAADAVILIDLLVRRAGGELEYALVRKFNAVSERIGSPERLP